MDTTDDIVIPADTSWLKDKNAQAVCRALTAGGHQALFVGGCVRNALLGLPDSDVDISTDALPDQTTNCAQVAGLKAVPTGIDHGTITVIAGGTPFEVTTFRRDVQTDGRRAVVAYSTDIADDARRRDFTMNALYATPDGKVLDPLGGMPDLMARRIRFIEDADARIQEDYLRILRFFRFSAWYANPDEGFDTAALSAIAQNIEGIQTLSAERVGQEMRKLLAAPDPARALAGMRSTGAQQHVLPGADDRWIGPIVHMEQTLTLDPAWLCRLAALGGEDPTTRLRLSKAEMRHLTHLRDAAYGAQSLAEIAYRHGPQVARQVLLLRCAMAEKMPETGALETIHTAAEQKFPIHSSDLRPTFEGPDLGARLAELEARWIASNFTLTKDALLDLP
ncbi:CCA tRNA nucleotidyltransferase [Sulfitobacter aestuariivivens]|uniref:CCA tRNA nucleotidyltransferase n=1 Tax=Sulfitobacter aestuariivivens TaxID=2766981 RepID=A0A927D5B9_9RHOB|nr:CCA tRNA nucleotidyltransferase [Sulfitobacter aestuariivivens]MBD3665254.1 CCA tRNA nucleotidyltransferase [Sulfitobacter aestuariivivens]